MRRSYLALALLTTLVLLLANSNVVVTAHQFPTAFSTGLLSNPAIGGERDIFAGKRSLRTQDGSNVDEERAFSFSGVAKLTDSIKANPNVQKYVTELKTIVQQLKNTAAYSKLIARVEKLADKVKTLPGAAKVAELYKKLKFWMWYKLKITPEDIYKKFKLGEGGAINTAKYDEHLQYQMFYRFSKREEALKKKAKTTA